MINYKTQNLLQRRLAKPQGKAALLQARSRGAPAAKKPDVEVIVVNKYVISKIKFFDIDKIFFITFDIQSSKY